MHEQDADALLHPPPGTSGWGPWANDVAPEPVVANAPLAALGGGLSLALWACATLLALQYL